MSVEMNCKVAGELVPISSGLRGRSGAHTGQVTSPLQGNYLNLFNLINGMIEVNAHTGKKYYIQLKECFAKVFCSLKQAFFQNKKKLQTVLIIFFQLSSGHSSLKARFVECTTNGCFINRFYYLTSEFLHLLQS
ncbi:hypothetical protein AMECASPLE_000692 [Ameca splendens]|uniref:Uncharacterized protein n=1 Tax=Ameca splendens TaxID=208324 RepID=A0ABV0YX36_9TELE